MWEVAAHHAALIVVLLYNVYVDHYLGYTIVMLLVEVNGIFLHGRKLLQQTARGYQHPLYGATVVVNLITFVVFRLASIAAVMHGMYVWRNHVSRTYLYFLLFPVIFLGGINVILFWRILKNDCLRSYAKRKIQNNNISNFKTYDEKAKTS